VPHLAVRALEVAREDHPDLGGSAAANARAVRVRDEWVRRWRAGGPVGASRTSWRGRGRGRRARYRSIRGRCRLRTRVLGAFARGEGTSESDDDDASVGNHRVSEVGEDGRERALRLSRVLRVSRVGKDTAHHGRAATREDMCGPSPRSYRAYVLHPRSLEFAPGMPARRRPRRWTSRSCESRALVVSRFVLVRASRTTPGKLH